MVATLWASVRGNDEFIIGFDAILDGSFVCPFEVEVYIDMQKTSALNGSTGDGGVNRLNRVGWRLLSGAEMVAGRSGRPGVGVG